MQTVLHVMAKSKRQKSLREVIATDLSKHEYDGLYLDSQMTKGRNAGWAKVKRKNTAGAINLEWDADTRTLIARAVSRGNLPPCELVGAFVAYLLRWYGKRISAFVLRSI